MDVVTFTTKAEGDRYVAAVQQALGKTYPIPGRRNGKTQPAGAGETLRYVDVRAIVDGFAVQCTDAMVLLDGMVERVGVVDVTIETDRRRPLVTADLLDNEEAVIRDVTGRE